MIWMESAFAYIWSISLTLSLLLLFHRSLTPILWYGRHLLHFKSKDQFLILPYREGCCGGMMGWAGARMHQGSSVPRPSSQALVNHFFFFYWRASIIGLFPNFILGYWGLFNLYKFVPYLIDSWLPGNLLANGRQDAKANLEVAKTIRCYDDTYICDYLFIGYTQWEAKQISFLKDDQSEC